MESKTKVIIKNGCMKKWYKKDFEVEYQKAITLWQLSKKCSFISPKPLNFDVLSQMIEYEYFPKLRSIREIYLGYLKSKEINTELPVYFRKLGVALAEIHEGLELSSRKLWQPSKEFDRAMHKVYAENYLDFIRETPHSFIHGDFGFSNIYYLVNNDDFKIIIIDSSYDDFTNFHSNTYASIYLDISHIISCIDGLVPFINYPFIHWKRLNDVKEAFLKAYENRSGIEIDRLWVARFAYASVVAKFSKRINNSIFRQLAIWTIYNSIKGNNHITYADERSIRKL